MSEQTSGAPAPNCLVPKCGRKCDKGQSARGMCGPCYQEARRAVALQQVTWLELQNLSLAILPQRKARPKQQTPFALALAEAKARSGGASAPGEAG